MRKFLSNREVADPGCWGYVWVQKSPIQKTVASKFAKVHLLRTAVAFLTALVFGVMTATPGLTQTVSGIQIGDTVATTSKQIGFPPNKIDRSGPVTYSTWKLSNNNKLNVTTRADDGKIVYMEIGWGQTSSTTGFP